MIQVKLNGNLYPASVAGRLHDNDWDGRESKAITMEGGYADVAPRFADGMPWSIVETYQEVVLDETGVPVPDEHGEPTYEEKTVEYDNTEFCVLGDITVHPNGTCTVKMGKETDEEKLLVLLYGGEA